MNDVAISPEPGSLASELQVVRQAFPTSLFDDDGWQRLLARAASIPASVIETTFGFELRLGRLERAADFCVTLRAGSDNASEFLSFPSVEEHDGLRESEEFRQGGPRHTSQRRLARKALNRLLAEVARDGSFANKALSAPFIILEFDVVEPEFGRSPAPGVFWGLAEHVGPEEMEGIVQMLDIVQLQPASSSHKQGQARGRPVNDSRVDTLHRVAETIIPYGRISQVGTFLGRKTSKSRILIHLEDRSSIGECLGDIGWPGNVDKVIDTVSKFDCENLGLGLALDVGTDGVGPRVGLEVAAKGGWHATRFAQWQPLIEVLVANGWCREEKAKGLEQWCGYMRLFGPQLYMLLKGINHFKMSIQNDEFHEAKAYLGACRVLAQDIGFE